MRLAEICEMLSAMLQKVYSHIVREKWEYNFLEVHPVSGSPCREIADVLTFYRVRFDEIL